jgi:hypothetical protein
VPALAAAVGVTTSIAWLLPGSVPVRRAAWRLLDRAAPRTPSALVLGVVLVAVALGLALLATSLPPTTWPATDLR